jgi:hypothetical protein
VLDYMHDNEFAARQALQDFEHDGHRPFQETWELDFSAYTFRFVWCLYAIVWTIRQYDHIKSRYQPAGFPFTFTRGFMEGSQP